MRKQLFIGGEWRDAQDGRTFSVQDPSTCDVLANVADASVADGRAALDAAVAAQDDWKIVEPRERADILWRAFKRIRQRADELALLMTLEMGKPISESLSEVSYAAEYFRWFSEEAVRISGRFSVAPDGNTRLLTMKQPVGPCLVITPWNFPLAMDTRKIGPAIAAGCTMVVKPAELTPLSMLALADVLEEAGLPRGVLNIITTSDPSTVTGPIIRDSRLRKLTFTGSTAVGKRLVEPSASGLLRTSMELGGNAPFLVFSDADINRAVEGAFRAKMRNVGEACTAANRFIVHESVVEEFSSKLTFRMSAMKIGGDGETALGPLIDRDARSRVAALVDDAVARGARVVTGGKSIEGTGFFYQPTVLRDVPVDCCMYREEIFGPVAPIYTFDRDEQGLAMANDTAFGLVAYAYTSSYSLALTVSEKLQTGMVGINQGIVSNVAAPFGGIKLSGFGREGGTEGIDEYLETKYVGLAL